MTQAKFGGDKNDIVSAIAGSNRNSGQTVHASHTRADGLGALRPLARRPHIRWTSLAWRGYCPVGLGRLVLFGRFTHTVKADAPPAAGFDSRRRSAAAARGLHIIAVVVEVAAGGLALLVHFQTRAAAVVLAVFSVATAITSETLRQRKPILIWGRLRRAR